MLSFQDLSLPVFLFCSRCVFPFWFSFCIRFLSFELLYCALYASSGLASLQSPSSYIHLASVHSPSLSLSRHSLYTTDTIRHAAVTSFTMNLSMKKNVHRQMKSKTVLLEIHNCKGSKPVVLTLVSTFPLRYLHRRTLTWINWLSTSVPV